MGQTGLWSRRAFVGGAAGLVATGAVAHAGRLPELAAAGGAIRADWQQQGVIDLRGSRYAKLRNVPVRAVTMGDGLWAERRKVNVASSIPTMYGLLEEHGRMDNFRRLMGKSTAAQRGPVYSDSDLYKWAEAASFAQHTDPALFREPIEAITKLVQGVQERGGYLNTYYVEGRAPLRMTERVQISGHELYCMGHLIQAAVAQYRATGDQRLLECCLRFVDDYLIPQFGPEAGKRPVISGHPEIEMGLLELYRLTGDPRHLKMAGYILEGDKRATLTRDEIVYMFCGIPFPSRTKLEGHAVRAMYACCGATDYYMETGDDRYMKTLRVLWEDLVRDQMYVNGGVGARRKDEAFGDAFELPNASAYGESCAAIGNVMWNWRLLHATGDARHADVIERALYNGINSGMSLSGTLYCYRNPLAFDPTAGPQIRNPWYDTTCCPPNLERTFASLPGYMYSTGAEGLYVHLFHNSTLDWRLETGLPIRVEQRTEYPWDGTVRITVSPAHEAQFTVYLRIPGWSKGTRVSVGGKAVEGVEAGKYLAIKRVWRPGDVAEMQMDMTPQMVRADSRVAEDQGRVAVQRGPVVYCAEDVDQNGKGSVQDLRIKSGGGFVVRREAGLLGGVDVLEHAGARLEASAAGDGLYADVAGASSRPATVRMVPYYAWANREPSGMAVWLPLEG